MDEMMVKTDQLPIRNSIVRGPYIRTRIGWRPITEVVPHRMHLLLTEKEIRAIVESE